MECRGDEDEFGVDNISVGPSTSAVNNLILDYYKKFGRKRDLEQFFSLSTAQTEIRNPTGNFWTKMKSEYDSSDSGEKKSESSTEICRISIKCSIPEPSSSQKKPFEEHQHVDSVSPPILSDEMAPIMCTNSDAESVKSEDVQSQRSHDAALDTSMNKPHSPTSSITSQRKLEWDSLADVGYANETDRKTSASSLSTLERLALNQQYSHNDSKQNMKLGPPTSHSTPVEEVETKSKNKKGLIKKSTKIYQKDVDLVELNVPHNSQTSLPQSISVNLSKHICFNVEKDGEINIDNIKKHISVTPEKNLDTSMQVQQKLDKEIQTSFLPNKDNTTNLKNDSNTPANASLNMSRFPVLISLNTLKNRHRKRKIRKAKRKLKNRNKSKIDNSMNLKSKANEQVSDAESFEYMPGHIYNQNHLKTNQNKGPYVDNKSSLESSVGRTTDSSKGSKHSFSKDLEKSIDLLRIVLQNNNEDSTLKKKLIKEVVQRLIKSKYRDDESSTDFLSGLSYNSNIIGKTNHTTTSTSDDKNKLPRPKKSILHTTKFNSNALASTSQSAPNLPSVSNSEKPVASNLTKPIYLSNTDSEMSSKEKTSSDLGMTRTSSEEFYKKYLKALKREQAYKKHLRDKENFLKQKLVSSDTAIGQSAEADLKTQSKLKSLLKDLTRNNYNDGSGDASKLEGYSNSNVNMDPHIFFNNQRSHSVFTLTSGNNDGQSKNPKLKNIIKSAIHKSSKPGCSKNEYHYCCCPYHKDHPKIGFTDSSVQVNIKCDKPIQKTEEENESLPSTKCTKCKKESRNVAKVVSDSETGDLKYICVCSDEGTSENVPDKFLIYRCSRLINKSVQLGDTLIRSSNTGLGKDTKEIYTCGCEQRNSKSRVMLKKDAISSNIPQNSKSSQTNVNLNLMIQRKCSEKSISSQFSDSTNEINIAGTENINKKLSVQEAIRCIQTDISINPRLSDPCLSDINIIDDNECVKLVKEHYKEVSKSNSENNTVASQTKLQPDDNSLVKMLSKPFAGNENEAEISFDYDYIVQLDKEVQSDLALVDGNENEHFTDQFTIPIQGTNMTLKVNLGTKESDKNGINNIARKSQGVVTETTNVAENFTSLREDCTKSIQCCEANILPKPIQHGTEQYNRNKNTNKNEESPPSLKTGAVNKCLVDKPKCNTFPKKDQIYDRKPLLRTNTDITNLKKNDLFQYDLQNNDKTANVKNKLNDCQKVLTDKPTKVYNQYQSDKCGTCSNKKDLTDETTGSNNRSAAENCTNCSNKKKSNKKEPEKCTACISEKVVIDQPAKPNIPSQSIKCTGCSNQGEFTDQPAKLDTQNQSKNPTTSKHKCQSDQPTITHDLNLSKKCATCSDQKHLSDQLLQSNKQNQSQKCTTCSNQKYINDQPPQSSQQNKSEKCTTCSNQKYLTDQPPQPNKQNLPQKCITCSNKKHLSDQPLQSNKQNQSEKCATCSNQKYLSDQPPHSNKQNLPQTCTTCSNQNYLSDQSPQSNKQNLPQKCTTCSNQTKLPELSTKSNKQHQSEMYLTCSSKCSKGESASKREDGIISKTQSKTSTSLCESHPDFDANQDPILDMIEGITKRYSKKDIERSKRKKCFKEIMNVLNYLLDTEDATYDQNKKCTNDSSSSDQKQNDIPVKGTTDTECCQSKTFVDKGVQLSGKKSKTNKHCNSESSEIAVTSEFPTTSSDSAACKVLNKIKKECEKYHQKRCKSHNGLKTCETSSTTSVNCDQCKRVHQCYCVRYKCKPHKTKTCGDKSKKKCVAYNLILQTSDSAVSEEAVPRNNCPLKSIIVKVPSKRKQCEKMPFKEVASKLERNLPHCSPRSPCRGYRSRSLPNESEISSTEDFLRKPQTYTVREYLERNRPDFVERCSRRQDCLKTINETRPEMCPSPYFKMVVVHTPKCGAGSCLDPCNMCYGGQHMPCNQCVDPYIQNEVTRIANERNAKRKLLSLQLAKQQTLSALTDEELRHFAKQLSEELRRKKLAPKFINERDMKKHSEKIYKSLPEVTRKKEELKKENIKKTNLLMANIFKKNLQKKTLRGSVNLSNYSTVIKI